MLALTYRKFVEARGEFDAAVARTPQVSVFCSGSAWSLAAHEHLLDTEAAAREERFLSVREQNHWLAFALREPHYFQPLEVAWMFGCPLIGPEPERSVELLERVARQFVGTPHGYLIGGVEQNGALHDHLRTLGARSLHYREFEGTGTMLIDLAKGAESWLGRRSRKFRKNLRGVEKKVRGAGIALESAGVDKAPEDLFQRILSIQKDTGKWIQGTDIFQFDDCLRFYRHLLGDLHRSGRLRLQFARRDDRDLAYIFGGVFEDVYRGMQMGYRTECADLGLGNFLQWDNLKRSESEGIRICDLGMPAPYKYGWADRERKTVIGKVVL